MSKRSFHKEPYDAGTLTKLQIFESYIEAWIPVFTSQPHPHFPEIHLFDFFSGPGTDAAGVLGSPLRILRQLKSYQASGRLHGWNKVRVNVNLSDANSGKVAELAEVVSRAEWQIPGVTTQVQLLKFEDALAKHARILESSNSAKLLIIDPFGVNDVSDEVFRKLISLPKSDFIFFVPSTTLNRFRDHASIKVKIDRPEDSYDVHRCAFDHFKVICGATYFLGRFSIRKPKGNIYGLIFGSRHQLGIHKFLEIAWGNDAIQGEANFDIDRENVAPGELLLPMAEMRPRKIQIFEQDLEAALRSGSLRNEADLIRFNIESGMISRHCRSVLRKLKDEGIIEADFQTPSIDRFSHPREIKLL